MKITQDDINHVPFFTIPNINSKDKDIVRAICQKVLYESMVNNDSKEVGLLLDSFDFNRHQWFRGTENSVRFTVDWNKITDMDEYSNRYIAIHNHPDTNMFSMRDISSFIGNPFYYCMIMIYVDGSVHMLYKERTTNINDRVWFKNNFSSASEFCKECDRCKMVYNYFRRLK